MQAPDKVTTIPIFLILTLLILPVTVLAAGEPRLRLSAETLSLNVGQETTIEILVENATPIYGVESHLTFDPTKLEVVDIQHGDFLSANPDTEAFILQKQADNILGTVDYALSLLNPAPPAAGNGLLLQITVQAKAEGPTAIQFDNGLFGTQTGQEIVPIMEGIEINIMAGANSYTTNNHQTSPETMLGKNVEYNTVQQSQPVTHQSNQANTPENVPSNVFLGLSLLFGAGMIGLMSLIGLVLIIGGWFWINRARRHHKQLPNSFANTTTRPQ